MQMTRIALAVIVAAGLSASESARAQTAPPSSGPANATRFSRAIKARFDSIKRDIVDAAAAVPEGEYTFKPTPEVRSFGELIGHIADSQNFFCGVASGANPEYSDAVEKTRPPTKTVMVNALKASMAKCDDAYGQTTAENALELVAAGKGDALRAMLLLDNISHDNEHYGNIVTYMRLKGHVPPSTARTPSPSK
jgi:uncharacterized damage-inducible protein DinB